MSNKRIKKKTSWGGCRKGSGKKPRLGGTVKICVSLNEENWQAAVNLWKPGKPSHLVNGLALRYVETGGKLLERMTAP